LNSNSKYASIVMVVTPDGVVLVYDATKPSPVYWKCPGGRSEDLPGGRHETALECALRELEEETGVKLSASDLVEVAREPKYQHERVAFMAVLNYTPKLASRGDEGEQVAIFKIEEIAKMVDFFPNHRKLYAPQLEKLTQAA
jgi:ADP-ribose pyrophosphatase YjhB (NUDIX family)